MRSIRRRSTFDNVSFIIAILLRLRLVFVQINGCRLFVTVLKFVEEVLLSSVHLGIQYQFSGTKHESRCASNHPEDVKVAKKSEGRPEISTTWESHMVPYSAAYNTFIFTFTGFLSIVGTTLWSSSKYSSMHSYTETAILNERKDYQKYHLGKGNQMWDFRT